MAAAVVLAGCGQTPPDLFVVQRSGADPNANLRLLVSDGGTVRCNGRDPQAIDAKLLLRAREIARELEQPGELGLQLEPGPSPVLSYRVRSASGTVSFSDTSRQRPKVFDQIAGFTHDVAEDVCDIQR